MGKITAIYDTHFLRENYGILQPLPDEVRLSIGKAILVAAGADGDLSKREMDYFLGLQKGLGATDAMLEQWQKFDYRGQRMDALLDKATQPYARIVLYDAIRVARSDGVQTLERDALVRMAKVLRIDPAHVPAIEALLGIEDALNAARIRVLSPVE